MTIRYGGLQLIALNRELERLSFLQSSRWPLSRKGAAMLALESECNLQGKRWFSNGNE